MNKTFSNTKEMHNVMEVDIQKALRGVSKELQKNIHDEIIDMGIGSGSDWYQSTGEFADAWREDHCTRVYDTADSANYELEIYYEPKRIRTFNQDLGQHTSILDEWQNTYPIEDILPELVFQGSYGLWIVEGRDAWTKFISDTDKSLNKIMKENFAKYGFKLIKTK